MLFKKFVSAHKCAYFKDGELLKELVLFDQRTALKMEQKFKLPEDTYKITGIFDRLIVRGENLGLVRGVAFSCQQKGRGMRLAKRSENELVLRSVKIPFARKPQDFTVDFYSKNEGAVVDVIALGSSHGVLKEFEKHQKTLVGKALTYIRLDRFDHLQHLQ